MQIKEQLENLKVAIAECLPEAKERYDETGQVTKTMLTEVTIFVMGYASCLTANGQEIHPLIHINLGCGRCDRFLGED